MRDERAATPNAANATVKCLKALFKWAQSCGLVRDNPTVGVQLLRARTDGHHTWTPEEIRRYLAHHPPGSKARLALALLLYTGARRSDVIRMGPAMVKDGTISFQTVKTRSDISIPILPALAGELALHPTIGGTWLRGAKGRAYSGGDFGVQFTRWAREAGCPGTAHGIRKAAATIAAENGATEAQLNAIFGWSDGSPEARLYVRAANKRKLAAAGARLISVPRDEPGTDQQEKLS